jgi:hypothetical protein
VTAELVAAADSAWVAAYRAWQRHKTVIRFANAEGDAYFMARRVRAEAGRCPQPLCDSADPCTAHPASAPLVGRPYIPWTVAELEAQV